MFDLDRLAGAIDRRIAEDRRPVSPFEDPDVVRTHDAFDERHLRPGAESISVTVGKARRARMNRLRATSGRSLRQQVCEALDCYFSRHPEVSRVRAADGD